MLLYRTRVSPKTPRDGKLEVSPRAAEQLRLAAAPGPLEVVVNGTRGAATVTTMECRCQKGGPGAESGHVHHFLQSELLKTLRVESEVTVERADAGGAIEISAAG